MRTLRIAATLVLTLLLGAAAGSAADTATINLIQLPADSSAEVYYAQDLGYFKDAGLDVHVTPMTNSAAIVSSLVGGAGDIGNSVIGSAAQARAKGIPLRFIAPAGLFVASEPTSALVVPKDSTLRTAADLTGKTVAVSGLQDLTYYATRAWIDQHGGDSTKVRFVEMPFPTMGPALATHRIDAAYDVEPFLTATSGDFRVFGNAAAAVANRFQATGWVATEAWLATHADVALRFAAVMRRTALWANTHHRESAQILLRYVKISPEIAEKMVRAQYELTLQPRLLQPAINIAAKYGHEAAIPADELIWQPAK
jgi:NitT/TauT family transport system substrate-binding protein